MKFVKFSIVTVLFLLICVTLLIAALYVFKNEEKKDITNADRARAGGQFIQLSRGYTHYEAAGPDTGKVVILVHGFSVPYFIWDSTFNYLAHHGLRVVRYDMYGRGYSDRPFITYDKALYMDQLSELIEKLRLKKPVSLAGVSFGGGVIADFAALHPDIVNKVVLIDPVYALKRPEVPQFVTVFKEAIAADERAYSQLSDFKHPDFHGDWPERYKPQMQFHNFRWAIASTQYNYPFNGIRDYVELNKAHKQVLLIWGRDDKTVPFKYSDSVRTLLKAQFYPVDDAGHLPIIEKANEVNARLVKFLK